MKSSQPSPKHEILHLLAEHKNVVSVGLRKLFYGHRSVPWALLQ